MEGKTMDDLIEHARKTLPTFNFDYFYKGAGKSETYRDNSAAYDRLRLRPRVLRDVSNVNCRTKVLGREVSVPFGISPSGMHDFAHPDAELATAKAAATSDGIFILSSFSSVPMEDIAKATPGLRKWQQNYIFKDRKVTEKLAKKAAANGFEAIVLTVDFPMPGQRFNATPKTFDTPYNTKLPILESLAPANEILEVIPGNTEIKNIKIIPDPNITWKDVEWLQRVSPIPVILKGILSVEDAVQAVERNIKGIIVSNHGGRQLDGTPATIEVLPEIVRAVRGRCDVYIDGGVRNGTDVFKALALGANMVFMGRGVLWGLIHSGEQGVRGVLTNVESQLKHIMGLTGCPSVKDIEPGMVVHSQRLSKL